MKQDFYKEIYESDRAKTLKMYGPELLTDPDEGTITNPEDAEEKE